jgi:hypothetical protein
MSLERLRVINWERVLRGGPSIRLGQVFAFVEGEGQASRVVSLLGPDPAELYGVAIDPLPLPALRLAGVTSDRALYRAGRDTVHLLAFHLDRAGQEGALELRSPGGQTSLPVRLNDHGLAPVRLRDLPTGEHEVRWADAPEGEPACAFTVAEYRLAPLVATLLNREMQGEPPRLVVTLQLETFGIPVEGWVRLELTDRGHRVGEARALAVGGVVRGAVQLTGEGPHALNVQLESDPSRTATVPLVGSRAAERSLTLFSSLGVEVNGSLLPGPGSRTVRGIALQQGAMCNTPFRLERVDATTARLTAVTQTGPVCVVAAHLLDPARRRQQSRPVMQPGEVLDIAVPGPLGLVAIGAFIDGQPWEGWAALLHPDPPAPRILVPPKCLPGSEVTITVETGLHEREASVYLIVKDTRLVRPDTPASRLAGQMKATVEALPEKFNKPGHTPYPKVPLGDYYDITVPPAVAELIPGSVAGENLVFPVAVDEAGTLQVLMIDPDDFDLIQKLQFILNRNIHGIQAPRDWLIEAINRHYGLVETESIDSMLAEFTDTAIDFMVLDPNSMGLCEVGLDADFEQVELLEEDFDDEDSHFELSLGGEEDCPEQDEEADAPPSASCQAEPEVGFAGCLQTHEGRVTVTVPLGDRFADYVVEAFVVSGLDWAEADTRFRAVRDPFVAFDLPAFVHAKDTATGRVHAGAASGRFRLRVTRDGSPVPLRNEGRPLADGAEIHAGRVEVTFPVGPGEYRASVEDLVNGASDQAVKRIDQPGKLCLLARSLRFLEPGQELACAADPRIRGLRVLPGLDRPFSALVDATADYGHCCCEQTAAKLLAGCAMYALAGDEERRGRAEAIILAGVRRAAQMWLRGRGFKIYPDRPNEPDSYLGPIAARYLWNLDLLRQAEAHRLSPTLHHAIGDGLEMARDTSAAYGFPWPPAKIASADDAYAVVRFGKGAATRPAMEWARNQASRILAHQPEASARNRHPTSPTGAKAAPGRSVPFRTSAGYAAACLLRGGAGGDRPLALALANAVVGQLNEQGRLYSTLDSVAAIALLAELRSAGIVGGKGVVEVNGRRSTTKEISGFAEARSVKALEGVVAVEVQRQIEEDWERFSGGVSLKVSLVGNGAIRTQFQAGDALQLHVILVDGYRPGDLLWVCLPDALTRLVGGGQVKLFAIDFAGRDEVTIPLAATAPTLDARGRVAPQHFAVCVRNMFDEDRAGNPGLLPVTVTSPASAG